jgi:multiple sugar transport system substrate-binding protein/sn-glycerol 3-phosphate transport system substrate-binding protein
MKQTLVLVLLMLVLGLVANAAPLSRAAAQGPATPTLAAVTPGATAVPQPTATPRPPRQAPAGATRIEFWHAMSGTNGNAIEEMGNRFNTAQKTCFVDPIFQGT